LNGSDETSLSVCLLASHSFEQQQFEEEGKENEIKRDKRKKKEEGNTLQQYSTRIDTLSSSQQKPKDRKKEEMD
jgi:hypothetical protein